MCFGFRLNKVNENKLCNQYIYWAFNVNNVISGHAPSRMG